MMTEDIRTRFLEHAMWHGSLDAANSLLDAHPEIVRSDIHVAAVLGDEQAVRDFLAADPTSVRRTSPPWDGDPLTYLGLSKYLPRYCRRAAGCWCFDRRSSRQVRLR